MPRLNAWKCGFKYVDEPDFRYMESPSMSYVFHHYKAAGTVDMTVCLRFVRGLFREVEFRVGGKRNIVKAGWSAHGLKIVGDASRVCIEVSENGTVFWYADIDSYRIIGEDDPGRSTATERGPGKCTCEIFSLMHGGCICGAFQEESRR